MKSVMQHQFSQVPRAEIPRSTFNRSHGYKTTFDAGYLVPFYVDEALPGDTFNLRAHIFARMSTPLVPLMDNLYLDTFYFAVPVRLVWNNFLKFNGEQVNPGDSTDYLVPQITAPASGGFAVGSLSDYFGLPTAVNSLAVSSLWHRAYNLIWNEWFRDENLQNSVTVDKGDGPDTYTNYQNLLRRGKRHDYFTSCLPWPQKGPGVQLSLGSTAPIYGTGESLQLRGYNGNTTTPYSLTWGRTYDQTAVNSPVNLFLSATAGVNVGTAASAITNAGNTPTSSGHGIGLATSGDTGLYADLSAAQAVTINSMRQAFQIQRLYERDARGGSRYTEIIRSHFGVISPDARLQRPEYLGGGSSRVVINPVQQTSSTDATTPQGHLAAYGLVADSGRGFTKSFTEHTLLIGLVNVRADLSYQQGVNRMFSRRTRFDFYWPALAHLGEQAVLNKEIYAQGTTADNNVFGYQERFAEYRYYPSQITGKFRSTYAQPLDVWHLAQKFTALPVLNSSFIQDDPPISRVVAVPSEPQFIFDSMIELSCARPMPVYGVPGLIDHF